jgi:hypothetical protein
MRKFSTCSGGLARLHSLTKLWFERWLPEGSGQAVGLANPDCIGTSYAAMWVRFIHFVHDFQFFLLFLRGEEKNKINLAPPNYVWLCRSPLRSDSIKFALSCQKAKSFLFFNFVNIVSVCRLSFYTCCQQRSAYMIMSCGMRGVLAPLIFNSCRKTPRPKRVILDGHRD